MNEPRHSRSLSSCEDTESFFSPPSRLTMFVLLTVSLQLLKRLASKIPAREKLRRAGRGGHLSTGAEATRSTALATREETR